MRIFFALCLLFWPSVAQAADWREAETRHFRIVSSGDEKDLRKFAERLEYFHTLLRMATGSSETSQRIVKVRVFLVPAIGDVKRLIGDSNSDVAGFYRPGNAGALAVVPRSTGDGTFTGQVILFHEYAHHFMLQYAPAAYPSWYVEGFAEIAATASFERKGAITYGKPASHRQYELEGGRYPVTAMIDGTYLKDRERGRGWSYGDAWLVTHYLTFTDTRRGQLRGYLNAINAGKTPAIAAQVFGNLTDLQREVGIYLNGRSFPYRAVPIAPEAIGEVAMRVLGPAESAVIDYTIELERRTTLPSAPAAADPDEPVQAVAKKGDIETPAEFEQRLIKATQQRTEWLTRLDALANRFAGDSAGWQLLARARCASEQYEACAAAADRALTLRPADASAMSSKAEAAIELAKAIPADQRAPSVYAAQELLLKAIAAEPDNPLPLIAFYHSFSALGRGADADGLNALATAVQLVPQEDGLRLNLASEYLARGRLRDARILLSPLAYSAHDSGAAKSAQAMLKAIEGRLEAEDS